MHEITIEKQRITGITEKEAMQLYDALDELGVAATINEVEDTEESDGDDVSEWAEQERREYYRNKI